MRNILPDLAVSLRNRVMSVGNEHLKELLLSEENLPCILAYYGAFSILGEDMLAYESESIQYILLSNRISVKNINKIVQLNILLSDTDYILSTADGFRTFVELVNDDEVKSGTLSYEEPEKIAFAILVAIAILNSINIPIVSDAVKYSVACLKEDGWEMPPLFFNSDKFFPFFDNFDKHLYEQVSFSSKTFAIHCSKDAKIDASSAIENFAERHKTFLQYIEYKIKEIKGYL